MKKTIFFLLIISSITISIFSCTTVKPVVVDKKMLSPTDSVKIANKELEYEIIIFDPGFNAWLNSNAKPRSFFSQSFLESRNQFWVMEWNNRVNQPINFNSNLYEMTIDYQRNINYGYEVNYMLFNYLNYFQITNKVSLGGPRARL